MRAVEIIHDLLEPELSAVHSARVRSVLFGVKALVQSGRLNLSAMGRGVRNAVAPKHNIKRMDRLLGNPLLHRDLHHFYRALATILVGTEKHPLVLVDWTECGDGFQVLSAALPRDGRALPFFWESYPEYLLGNRELQFVFLDKLAMLLPVGCKPIIVTDAGFLTPWFRHARSLGWHFVGRLPGGVQIRRCDSNEVWKVNELYPVAGAGPIDFERCYGTKDSPTEMRVLIGPAWKRTRKPARRRRPITKENMRKKAIRRNKEPWVLCTSLYGISAEAVLRIYTARMQIEELFRDTKNHRFGWCFRATFTNSCRRINVYLLLCALGMLALSMLGAACELLGLHKRYQANTAKRRVLSLFFLGKTLVQRDETDTVHYPGPLNELLALTEFI